MKKKKSRIPDFKNIKEEAEFWDTHSFTDYWDDLEDVDIIFEVDEPREESLVLRVQKKFKEKLRMEARKRGLNISTLARMWLMEKLQTT